MNYRTKAKSGQTWSLGVLAGMQLMTIIDCISKLDNTEGIEQTDAVLSIVSSAMGLTETYLEGKLLMWELRNDGMRTITSSAATSMARLRLAAGVFGFGASALDAVLTHLKAKHAARSGDVKTAQILSIARTFYGASSALSALGALSTYQAYMAKGIMVRQVGVRAATLMGGWLVGVGIILSLAAFGTMLYSLHTAYQVTDMFLDRSYWGKGEHEKFGKLTREQLAAIGTNKNQDAGARHHALHRAVGNGIAAEVEAFLGLTIGLEAAIEWQENMFKEDAVAFTLKGPADWPLARRVALKLELTPADKSAPKVVINERDLTMQVSDDPEDQGRFKLEKPWVFKNGSHKRYVSARASFEVYEKTNEEIISVVRDTIVTRRDA